MLEEARKLAPKRPIRAARRAGCCPRPIARSGGFRVSWRRRSRRPRAQKRPEQPNAGAASGAARPAGANRLETGGEIKAPALELVATAQAAGKLDELAERVRSVKPEGGTESPEFERGRLALLGLIQVARGDDAGALKTIAAIEPPLKKLGPDAPVLLALARAALRHAGARAACAARSGRRAAGHPGRPDPQATTARRSLPELTAQSGIRCSRMSEPACTCWPSTTRTRPRAERRSAGKPRAARLGARHPQPGRDPRSGSAAWRNGTRAAASSCIIPATTST